MGGLPKPGKRTGRGALIQARSAHERYRDNSCVLRFANICGAIKRTRRSHFQITDRGTQLLKENPTRIDVQVLKQFPEFIAFQTPKAVDEAGNSAAPTTAAAELPESAVTPEEAVQQAEAQILENLKSHLLVRIWELSPSFFERLVVDLIVAMGYGG